MNAGNPMRLALSHYLRTLRERDEFDRLLPELLTQMGYVPLVKPKAGVRQFGVDFPAAGRSLRDGANELLLFVIKPQQSCRHHATFPYRLALLQIKCTVGI